MADSPLGMIESLSACRPGRRGVAKPGLVLGLVPLVGVRRRRSSPRSIQGRAERRAGASISSHDATASGILRRCRGSRPADWQATYSRERSSCATGTHRCPVP